MNLQAEKLRIVREVLDIEDINLIKEIKNLLQSRAHDWFDELSEEQQQSVMKSIEKLDKGEGITHEEAMTRLGL